MVMVGALAIVADLEDGGEAWAGIRVCFVRWRMVKEWNRRCARGGGCCGVWDSVGCRKFGDEVVRPCCFVARLARASTEHLHGLNAFSPRRMKTRVVDLGH